MAWLMCLQDVFLIRMLPNIPYLGDAWQDIGNVPLYNQ